MQPIRIFLICGLGWFMVGCAPQSKSDDPLSAAADQAMEQSQTQTARDLYRQALADTSMPPEQTDVIHKKLADIALQQSAFQDAELHLKAILNSEDEVLRAQAQLALGNLYLRQGSAQYARDLFERLDEDEPNNEEYQNGLALSYDFLRAHNKAQEVYKKALTSFPGSLKIANNFALSLALSHQFEKAIEQLKQLPQDNRRVRHNMAVVYALANKPIEARKQLQGMLTGADIDAFIERMKKPNQAEREILCS